MFSKNAIPLYHLLLKNTFNFLFSRLHAVDRTEQRMEGGRDDIGIHASAPGDMAVIRRNADIGHSP